jgi:hypothetical protein
MTKTSFADSAALISPRTVKYIEALARDGDNFDYDQWLKRAREEEAQATQGLTATTGREVVAAQVDDSTNASDSRDTRPSVGPAPISKPAFSPRALRRPHPPAKGKTPKARLMRWLERISSAWDEFQASRNRDAVYGYLDAVFEMVMHYKVRRRTKRLLQHACKFGNLPFDKNADPFSAVIRCTCDDDVDNKTISKWARALRYVAHCKGPGIRLETFMKEAGGVNACANGYAKCCGRSARNRSGAPP